MDEKSSREFDVHTRALIIIFAVIIVMVFGFVFTLMSLGSSSSEPQEPQGEIEIGEIAAKAIARYVDMEPIVAEVGGNLTEEDLRARALVVGKALIPEVVRADVMMPDQIGITFTFYNDKGDGLGSIHLERAAGRINFFSSDVSLPSNTVNISLGEAQAVAEAFLKSFGVDTTLLAPSTAEMNRPVVTGSPTDPIYLYEYRFNFEPQVNGVFVDCLSRGGAMCSVSISPEDGSILNFSLPRSNISDLPEPPSEIKIGKEEAIEIARQMAQNAASTDIGMKGMKRIAELADEEITMRYWLDDNNALVPYWTITFHFAVVPEADIPENYGQRGFYIGGASYSINAEDGTVIKSSDFM